MELICGHESLLALSKSGASPILDASFWRARSSYLLSGRPWPTVRMKQTALGESDSNSREGGDRSRADIENNEVYKTLWFCSRQALVALEAASACFSCEGESLFFHFPELS